MRVEKTAGALTEKGYKVIRVKTGREALEAIKKIIPQGASVMNGASVTLEQIGYVDLLKSGEHKWDDLHAKVTSENNQEKRSKLRRQSVLSDYYLGSVHALVENGEFLIASNSGSQLPHIVFTSPNLIFVVGKQKIAPDFNKAMLRLTEHVIPMEDKHMQELYGIHTALNKLLVFKGEMKNSGRNITFILVDENLGF